MSWELFIPYVLATTLILVIPGPTIILVISRAAAYGHRSVLPLVAGVFFGDFTAMTLSLIGLGAVVSASATVFTILKWIGALYLIHLGVKQWRSKVEDDTEQAKPEQVSSGALFKNSYIVTALNPKSIAFFVAFLPQFVSPRNPVLPQLLLLGGTFLFLAVINAGLYAIFAERFGAYMRTGKIRRYFNRCGAGALIGAGIITAGMQRTS